MKQMTIWEYICCVTAIITVLFVMALISGDRLSMAVGLKIVYASTFPFILVRTLNKKGKYFAFFMLYILLAFFIFKS